MIKVAGRCNLACDHCYVYQDESRPWLDRPAVMSRAVARAAAIRIAEHARARELERVTVVLHGGEPLLLRAEHLAGLLTEFRTAIEPVAPLHVMMQSNGLRITPELGDLLAEHHVHVAVSLDGDEAANDRHRVFRNGLGSYRQTLRGLEVLRAPPRRGIYGGLLCTIDVANDPLAVYEALVAQEPPRMDFLLPHATWDSPPPGGTTATPYADWLLTIHARWLADRKPVPIRLFESLDALLAGRPSHTESLGAQTRPLATVETDGTWEQVDSLKTIRDDAPRTGLDVHRHGVGDFSAHPGVRARDSGDLSATCRACPEVAVCGGGLYAHRYGRGQEFDNPSVYCADLLELIRTVRSRRLPGPATTATDLGLPAEVLRDLVGGAPTAASTAVLLSNHAALDRILLGRLGDASDDPAGSAVWRTLIELDDDPRFAAAVRATLAEPAARAEVRRVLRRPGGSSALLAALAASVVRRAGTGPSIEVPPRYGVVALPGLGAMPANAPVLIGPTGGPGPGWEPVRTVEAGGRLIRVDDVDPGRDCFGAPVAPRLGSVVDLAGPGIPSLITTLVPLRPVPGGRPLVTSSAAAFGALAVSAPSRAEPADRRDQADRREQADRVAAVARQGGVVVVGAVHAVCPLGGREVAAALGTALGHLEAGDPDRASGELRHRPGDLTGAGSVVLNALLDRCAAR